MVLQSSKKCYGKDFWKLVMPKVAPAAAVVVAVVAAAEAVWFEIAGSAVLLIRSSSRRVTLILVDKSRGFPFQYRKLV
jgi:hypothetical protein